MAEGGFSHSLYDDRLETFDSRWTGKKDKTELAEAGFIFTGTGDKVECTSCGLKLLNWTPSDDPLHEHATRRPLCSFINSRYRQLRQNKPPKHPQYQELQARLDSFVAWPGRYVPKTPEELAAAGFFYIGSADRVTCFQCGITLRDWEEEHDPITEHQRYSENCQFINTTDLNQLGVETRTVNERDSNQSDRNTETNDVNACGGTVPSASVNETEKEAKWNHSAGACDGTTELSEKDANETKCLESSNDEVGSCAGTAAVPRTEKVKIMPEIIVSPSLVTPVHDNEEAKNKKESQTGSQIKPMNAVINTHPRRRVTAATKRLAEENRRLKARRTCKVCKRENVSILFLPCGHLVTCESCAPDVSDCVTCGKAILGTVRTYFV